MKTNNNFIADLMVENRLMASVQLTADDMTKVEWQNYRALCDNIAIEAYKSITNNDKANLGGVIKVLFDALGVGAKATSQFQKRYVLACVTISKNYSVKYKTCQKSLRAAKTVLEDAITKAIAENPTMTEEEIKAISEVATASASVTSLEEELEELKATPGNVWNNFKPMLTADKKHASPKCRKYIEDITADIISEREMMSYKELLAEHEALVAERKANKKIKNMSEEDAKAELEKCESDK